MAPLNFEEDIKQRLEQRTIKPTKGSWEKLEYMLADQEGQKRAKKYWQLGVAASIIGIIILTSIFINSSTKLIVPDAELVDTDKDSEVVKEDERVVFEQVEDEILKIEKEKNQKATESATTKNNLLHKRNVASKKEQITVLVKERKRKIDKKSIKESMIAETAEETIIVKPQEKENTLRRFLKNNNSIIQEKIADILTQVEDLERNNTEVTNAEVDELLRKAQQDITTEQILKTNTVSASALLLDVESKLDESFKKQVFEALKSGFYKIKASVVERDN